MPVFVSVLIIRTITIQNLPNLDIFWGTDMFNTGVLYTLSFEISINQPHCGRRAHVLSRCICVWFSLYYLVIPTSSHSSKQENHWKLCVAANEFIIEIELNMFGIFCSYEFRLEQCFCFQNKIKYLLDTLIQIIFV